MSDETQIAQELAKKVPKEKPWTNGYPPDEKPEEAHDPNNHYTFPIADSQTTMELMDYFNLGVGARHNAETSEQMNQIIQWAKDNAEAPDLAGILRTLRHTETILGSTLKPDRLARLYRFVRIQSQKAVLAEKERALYNG